MSKWVKELDEQSRSGVTFEFDADLPCSVQLFWGVSAEALDVQGPMGVLAASGKAGSSRTDRSSRNRPAWGSQGSSTNPGASQRQYQRMRSAESRSPVQPPGSEGIEMQIMDTSELGGAFADGSFRAQSECAL
jgi:hypothetical protein